MKKGIFFLVALIIAIANMAFAQFVVYNPPVSISISDIEYNTTSAEVVMSSDAGVLFFDGTNWTQTTIADGLPSNDAKCVATSVAGAVLTGTNSGLAAWNGSAWTPYTLNTTAIFSYVSSIYVHQASDTLYGTDNGKFLRKSAAPTAATIVFSPAVSLFTHIGYMNAPGAYDFIIGTSTNGAVIYDLPTTTTFVVNTASTPIPSNNILSHDIEGNKSYDGTDQGVYIADFTTFPSMTTVTHNTGNSQIPSNIIQAVAVRNGVQWYGTPNGLAKLVGAAWTIYNTANSNLPSDDVVELAYDMTGDILWIGTGDGNLSKFDPNLSIDDISEQQNVLVSPNPSTGIFTLEGENMKRILVTNMEGKVIQEVQVKNNKFTLDLGEQIKGVYFLEVTTDKGTQVEKLIVR